MISLFSRVSLIIFIIRYITLNKNLIMHTIMLLSINHTNLVDMPILICHYPIIRTLSEAKLVKRIAEKT